MNRFGQAFIDTVKGKPAGFSVVELLLCLAVLSVLSLVGFHTLRGMVPSARVNRAAREVASLLERTRWMAVEQGTVFKVAMDSDRERLTVYRQTSMNGGMEEPEPVHTLDLRERHPGIVLGAAASTFRTSGCKYVSASGIHLWNHSVRFLPTGTTDRCGSLYLLPERDLPDHQEHMAALSVLLGTGRIQLWRYDPHDVSGCAHAGAWVPVL